MSQSSNIAIVILAAGASTRMGKPKQLLKWVDSTLIEHTIGTAKSTTAKEVFVVLGANHQIVRNAIKDEAVSFIVNKDWEKGLGKSIAIASNTLLNSNKNFDGILFILGDQPLVSNSYLNKILNRFQPNKKQIIVTSYGNEKMGVPVLFDKLYLTELSLLEGDKGAKSIIEQYESDINLITPDFDNIDIDTKEDYERVLKLYFNKKRDE